MIYLDNAATTQLDPRVLESMMPYLMTQYGNAGTLYRFGRAANEAIQEARARVARFIGAGPDSIIFTSGGSEANNLVFHGVRDYLKRIGRTHVLVSAVEHDSVLRAAESLIKDGFDVEYIPVLGNGTVPSAAVERALRADTGLVSVMYVNNETGVENPVGDIGSICLKHGVLFHTDCVQAAGCHPIDTTSIGCDFLSISAHKIHGPKGTGALYAKDSSILSPLIYGGHDQEFGLRGGTENVAGIVGFGRAYLMCLDILEKGDIVTYRGNDLDLLMSIRHGEYQKEDGTYRQEFFDMVNEFEARLAYAKENTALPENPDMKRVEEFVMEVNRRSLDG